MRGEPATQFRVYLTRWLFLLLLAPTPGYALRDTMRTHPLTISFLLVSIAATNCFAQLQFKAESGGLVITNGSTKVIEYVHSDPQILRPHFTRAHSPSGLLLTRANPPVAGVDAIDHPTMHPGIWLAWGDINGQDFWRNKARIEHVRYIDQPKLDQNRLTFATENHLVSAEGIKLGTLINRLSVALQPMGTVILWQARLQASDAPLKIGDQEEMGFGVRMATALTEKKSGVITNSAGVKSAAKTWGQAADWCDYSGKIDDRACGITVLAAPTNFRPSWWHNRDYGLCVANPFAKAAMKQGASEPVTIEPGQSQTFTFGAILHDGDQYDPGQAFKQVSFEK